MIADVILVAAVVSALTAGIGGWFGGRRAVGALAVSVVLLLANLIIAWNESDAPETTIEGGASAVGIMLAVGLFVLSLLLAVAGWTSRRLLKA